ncbi:OmpW family protein [Acinetobacter guillouiae]|uniref:OmpW/AlkL family protein n=1 Tax=Acinetobacter guillouiae TaxID=106649 RepID=UPI003AF99849
MKLKNYIYTLSICAISAQTVYATPYFKLSDKTDFKRYSISIGWLYAKPLGDANNIDITTTIPAGSTYTVGDVTTQNILGAIDQSTIQGQQVHTVISTIQGLGISSLSADLSGTVTLNQPSNWTSPNTGLEVEDINTLGIMFNYYLNDNISLELKAGIPPKVKAKGIGEIYAPVIGQVDLPPTSTALIGTNNIPISQQIYVTDLAQSKYAINTKVWMPAIEAHYQFGISGINKFRPYVGVGILYAYLENVKINSGIENDLILAGHRVQNILTGKAGDSLAGISSDAKPIIKISTRNTFAPVISAGFNYDFNSNWFAVASLSYSKMDIDAKIDVNNQNNNQNLISGKVKIDVDPLISYMGIGYRF